MPTNQTPGVYIEEFEFDVKPIECVATSIVAFIGETQEGSEYKDTPTLVTSWGDFVNKFGYYTDSTPYMAPAVFSFFLNGGSKVFIVKTLDSTDASIVGTDKGEGLHTGLTSLIDIDEVTIVIAPGITTHVVLKALIAHCELLKDRIAILDAAESTTSVMDLIDTDIGYINDTVSENGYAALYTPWYKSAVEYIDTADNDTLKTKQIFIPPSGAIAGIYARVDSEHGVHKAPANVQIRGALDLKVNYKASEQSLLNPKGVNCIRKFPGRGILVWGARTTASNPLWKYINVRRLFIFLEKSIDKGTKWVLFEPNNEKIWVRVKQVISGFLMTQWRKGALQGSRPEEAFYVKCDRETMTQDDIDNSRLICEIGVAPMRPAEFMIFRIAQWTASTHKGEYMPRNDPYRNYQFLVEIDGIIQAGFSEMTILNSSQDTIENYEGSDQLIIHKTPGVVTYGNIILKRGMTETMELYNWHKQVKDGGKDDYRRNMVIILMNEKLEQVGCWKFFNAKPHKYDAYGLKSEGSEITIENLEIFYEGMKRL